jgi:hypothetical protein
MEQVTGEENKESVNIPANIRISPSGGNDCAADVRATRKMRRCIEKMSIKVDARRRRSDRRTIGLFRVEA